MKLIWFMLLVLLASIVSFVLGYWKAGIILGMIFAWLCSGISEIVAARNSDYLMNRKEEKRIIKKTQ